VEEIDEGGIIHARVGPSAGEERSTLHRDTALVPDRKVDLSDHRLAEAPRYSSKKAVEGVINPLSPKGELQDPAAAGFGLEVRVNEKRMG
jgi:hypothetical protein